MKNRLVPGWRFLMNFRRFFLYSFLPVVFCFQPLVYWFLYILKPLSFLLTCFPSQQRSENVFPWQKLNMLILGSIYGPFINSVSSQKLINQFNFPFFFFAMMLKFIISTFVLFSIEIFSHLVLS